MSNIVKDIRGYPFAEEEKLFVDANVWYYIYGPTVKPEDRAFKKYYSNALEKIIKSKREIFIDVLVLSEFINTYARYFHGKRFKNLPPHEKKDFKKYRSTEEFKREASLIINETKKIMKLSSRCNLDFEATEIDLHLSEFEGCKSDFNDIIYKDICKTNDFTLVTNDGDFKKCGIPILTANSNLISQ